MENIIKKNLILISSKGASYVSKRNLFDKLTGKNVIVEFDNKKTAKKFIKQWNSRNFIGEFRIEKKISHLLKPSTIFSIYKMENETPFKITYEKGSYGFLSHGGNKSFNRKVLL